MPDGHALNPDAIQALRELGPEGDQEFFQELIAIYLADTPKQMDQLEDALNRQDAVVATRAAHTMKGSSSNFGAEQLSRLAQEIEKNCKAGNISAAAAGLPNLKREFALVVAELRQLSTTG